MKDEAQKKTQPVGARSQLGHLEQAIRTELGALHTAVEPLLVEVRADVNALHPESGGTRLAPKEQESRQDKLLGVLNELEDVLEALQLAVRSGRPGPAAASGEE
ncbi:hypothetical protein [Cystobacter ferrugineus]|uniref:Uncharacterized protein n=1 Tax=Cystobacter ferrugineus TaxID=83449 RepID=A0A1L9BDI2_9BACT|nr:hypothetical protein [Cystobacter ferrugineus]OJH40314.1 hypothetical protein BON30_14855 [Cystobacter ferrugineus]